MKESSTSVEMVFRTIQCFSDDGVLDADELDEIVSIAMTDGVLDDKERRVLKEIIMNLSSKDLTPALWERVEQLVERFRLDEVD